jgi:hypothetical protein
MSVAGHNTGNLLFTNAVWDQIDGPVHRIGFNIDPETANREFRAVVIPAANWFSPHVNFAEMAEKVEQLDIPVVMIGLGAQGDSYSGKIDVPEGTVRLVRAVAERSSSISVRGHYTKSVLADYGITKVTVTGCPSLYKDFRPDAAKVLRAAAGQQNGPTLLHSTRYFASHRPFAETASVHRDIFRLAFKTGNDLLMQSEPEEISMIVPASKKPEIAPETLDLMLQIYGAPNEAALEAYIKAHARVFFDVEQWSDAMCNYGRAFGTRLHATIMALNSGVPAVLVHHDSRTKEVCEFAKIPSVSPTVGPLSENTVRRLIKDCDFEPYANARRENFEVYQTFLEENRVSSALPIH